MKKRERHTGVVLVVTTVCLIIITTFLRKGMTLTKLDVTYLYMLIFLCIKSLIQEGRD